jgi:hypothetical protein
MELRKFLEDQRTEYLQAFEILCQRIVDNGSHEAFLEPIDKVGVDDKQLAGFFPFFRYDILVKADNEEYYEVKVNINPAVFVSPEKFSVYDIEISIESFAWNGTVFIFSDKRFSMALIHDWHLKWIKPDRDQLKRELQEVIHTTACEFKEIETLISIDFGSIPLAGVFDLFEILSTNGVKRVTIKSLYE